MTQKVPHIPFSWPGIIGLTLALSLSLGWAVTLVVSALPGTPDASDDALQLLNGIGQVLAGAVATFLGSSITSKVDTRVASPVDSSDGLTPQVRGVTPAGPVSAAQAPPSDTP